MKRLVVCALAMWVTAGVAGAQTGGDATPCRVAMLDLGSSNVLVVGAGTEGGSLTRYEVFGDAPVWGDPDGEGLYFVRYGAEGGLERVVDGQAETLDEVPAGFARLAPGATHWVTRDDAGDIVVIDRTAERARQTFDLPDPLASMSTNWSVWAPDGRRALYLLADTTNERLVPVVIDREGGTLRAYDGMPTDLISASIANAHWSPDGRWLALETKALQDDDDLALTPPASGTEALSQLITRPNLTLLDLDSGAYTVIEVGGQILRWRDGLLRYHLAGSLYEIDPTAPDLTDAPEPVYVLAEHQTIVRVSESPSGTYRLFVRNEGLPEGDADALLYENRVTLEDTTTGIAHSFEPLNSVGRPVWGAGCDD